MKRSPDGIASPLSSGFFASFPLRRPGKYQNVTEKTYGAPHQYAEEGSCGPDIAVNVREMVVVDKI